MKFFNAFINLIALHGIQNGTMWNVSDKDGWYEYRDAEEFSAESAPVGGRNDLPEPSGHLCDDSVRPGAPMRDDKC